MKAIFLFLLPVIFCLIPNKIHAQIYSDGTQITLINSINPNGTEFIIEADFVQMLTGKAAVTAAKKTREAAYDIIAKGDTSWYVPNDYFIVNKSNKVRKLVITLATQIFLVKEGSSKIIKSTASQLKRSFEGKLYKLCVVKNKIVKLIEIYTP